ncbi:MAG TPA: hypothetical protein VF458_03635 [Ktedonobacteraceae bacterium]
MLYRATNVSQDPLTYFMQQGEDGPRLRISDVVLRINHSHREVLAHLIRVGTKSQWSHSALVSLVNAPTQGLENTFLVEARPKGVIMTSWRNEVLPFNEFTVGIKRPRLDWYQENPHEQASHDPGDSDDTHAIAYLRHVRGVALDQMHGLFDQKVVWELVALYLERLARHRLSKVPQVAEAAGKLAEWFKQWDKNSEPDAHVMRFICSGLVQYSFFAALHYHVLQDFQNPHYRESALHNLRNMQQILYREDPEALLSGYIQRILAGERDLADPVPDDVQDLLKTALPADFHNSPCLEWRYIVLNGCVWQIDSAPPGYTSQSADEDAVLEMLLPEGNFFDSRSDAQNRDSSISEK